MLLRAIYGIGVGMVVWTFLLAHIAAKEDK